MTTRAVFVFMKLALLGFVGIFLSSVTFAQSMYVNPTGRVGIGTDLPSSSLEVIGNPDTVGVGNSVIKLSKEGGLAFQLDDTLVPGFWNFSSAISESEFRISRSGTGQTELILTELGDLTITGQLVTSGPTCDLGCDAVLKPEYKLLSIEEHAEQMREKSFLPAIGPTNPAKPINISDQYGNMLNELETAHIYIVQLNEENETLHLKVNSLETRLSELEALLSQ
jgi:hypothetical protein